MTELLWKPTEPSRDSSEHLAEYSEIALRELYEMGVKWGNRLNTKQHIAVLDPNDFGVDSDIRVTANAKDEDQRLIVRRGSNKIMTWMPLSDKSDFSFFFLHSGSEERQSALGIPYIVNKPEILVAYDTSITLEESFSLFVLLGRQGYSNGLIDEALVIQEFQGKKTVEPEKLVVDTFFEKEGSKIAIMPDDEIDDLLSDFDKPDELVVITDTETGTPLFITHKKWQEYHQKRNETIQSVMDAHGLNRLYLYQLAANDPKTFMPILTAVMEEVEQKLSNVGKQEQTNNETGR